MAILALSVMTGCGDTPAPGTAPNSSGEQSHAVARLLDRYEAAAAADRDALLDEIVVPLAKICADEQVIGEDRSRLVRFMADVEDERAEPCLQAALEHFVPGRDESDVEQVLRAVAARKLTGLAPQVFALFEKVEASEERARPFRIQLLRALVAVIDRTYEDNFIQMLAAPIDPEDQRAAVNQRFRQTAAARALGDLRSERAVSALVKVLFTPSKQPIHDEATLALTKIGTPAIQALVGLISGKNEALTKSVNEELIPLLRKTWQGLPQGERLGSTALESLELARQSIGARALGDLGSAQAIEPLVRAIQGAQHPSATRPALALPLTLLPHFQRSEEQYYRVFEDAQISDEFTVGLEFDERGASTVLADGLSEFFDAAMVPRLVELASQPTEESATDLVGPPRCAAFLAALRVMTPSQTALVDPLGRMIAYPPTILDAPAKKAFKTTIAERFKTEQEQARALLTRCDVNVECYLSIVRDENNQTAAREFTALKAVYMIGVLGGIDSSRALLSAMPRIKSATVMQAAVRVLEHFAKEGDADTAKELEALYDGAERTGDEELILRYHPMIAAAARLRLRLR